MIIYLKKLFGLPHNFSYIGHSNVCTRGKLLPPSTIYTGVNSDCVTPVYPLMVP